MKQIINKLLSVLTKRDKKLLVFVFSFSVFISMLEIVGIGVIMPFIAVASDFTLIHTNKYYMYIYECFGFKSDISFVVLFGVILIGFYLFRSIVNVLYSFSLSKFIRGRYFDITNRLFKNYLGRSYRIFIDKNSSELTKALITEAHGVTVILSSLLMILTEVLIIVLIYALMIYINYKVTLLLTILLSVSVILLKFFISNKIKNEGIGREISQKLFYEVINSTFRNFKVIKLRSNDDETLQRLSDANEGFAVSQIRYDVFTNIPRLFLEALAFSIVILITVYLLLDYQRDISSFMAMITMFVLGLYRLMPSVNKIFTAYNNILYHYKSLDIIHNDMICETEELKGNIIAFKKQIELSEVAFSYVENKAIIDNISFVIEKGSKVAFIGESGSGKSTLADIVMGLYTPTKGEVFIDGQSLSDANIKDWRKKIGYIPQDIYLFDGDVAQNVAFGEEINEDKVKNSLAKANILDFLESHHQGIYTSVGEGGLKLSGGQKQRIAIARALYSDPEVLVLDEATSALDSETEEKVMEEIYNISMDKTLIVIAHRLSTIEQCDVVYKLEKGKIIDIMNTKEDNA